MLHKGGDDAAILEVVRARVGTDIAGHVDVVAPLSWG